MSYGLTAYAVDLQLLQRIFGSGDERIVVEVGLRLRPRVEQLRVWLPELDPLEAVGELVDGRCQRPRLGHVYGYALQLLCDLLGHALPNDVFSPCRLDWLELVDGYMDEAGVASAVRLGRLIGEPPLPVPRSDEYPLVGFWEPADLARALPGFDARPPAELVPAWSQLRGWLVEALERDAGIVGFYL